MPQKSDDLGPIRTPVLCDRMDEVIPTVTRNMNKSVSSGIVPQCFKHDIAKPLLE